jgi:hypothetical protein
MARASMGYRIVTMAAPAAFSNGKRVFQIERLPRPQAAVGVERGPANMNENRRMGWTCGQ